MRYYHAAASSGRLTQALGAILGLLPSCYFAGYIAFSAWSFHDDIKSRVTRTRILAELVSDLGLLSTALAYWLPSVRLLLGSAGPFIFSLAVAGLLVQVVGSIRRQFPAQDFTATENVAVAFVGTVLVALMSAPLLYWGFSATVLRVYAGT